ncbi:MAG: hypothetical protein DRJ50_15125 [Actinobacteria bacterium]|nr:MAG: hypothetical protein DRJ50_15125 [Actinomycetota bacterium]
MRQRTCPYNNGPILHDKGNRYRCQKCGMVYHKDVLKDSVVWDIFTRNAATVIRKMRDDPEITVGMLRQSLGVTFTTALAQAREEADSAELSSIMTLDQEVS